MFYIPVRNQRPEITVVGARPLEGDSIPPPSLSSRSASKPAKRPSPPQPKKQLSDEPSTPPPSKPEKVPVQQPPPRPSQSPQQKRPPPPKVGTKQEEEKKPKRSAPPPRPPQASKVEKTPQSNLLPKDNPDLLVSDSCLQCSMHTLWWIMVMFCIEAAHGTGTTS